MADIGIRGYRCIDIRQVQKKRTSPAKSSYWNRGGRYFIPCQHPCHSHTPPPHGCDLIASFHVGNLISTVAADSMEPLHRRGEGGGKLNVSGRPCASSWTFLLRAPRRNACQGWVRTSKLVGVEVAGASLPLIASGGASSYVASDSGDNFQASLGAYIGNLEGCRQILRVV